MILGTAGHIDHGKTALVHALTGIDTDRLPEEKRRGITIELGFAPLVLDGIGELGVVDVPGHDAFVRTMVAGASGIDLALIVIAADEGLMPQTREHLQILGHLGVKSGVVAMSRCDLVDDAWLALVEEDVRATLASTPFAHAPMVRTSAKSGLGIAELRRALAGAARGVPSRPAGDLFRMPIDRAFTVKGAGTIITGTIWSGTLSRESALRLFPGDRVVRIRGLHSHGKAVETAHAGERAAIALAGVDVADVSRGGVVVQGDAWRESRILRAAIHVDHNAAMPGPRSRIRLHLGTADVAARLVAPAGGIVAGDAVSVRVVLDKPVVARAGDRFVLRTSSPRMTIGGGVVLDPSAPLRARPFPVSANEPAAILPLLLAEARHTGIAVGDLPIRLGVLPSAVSPLLAAPPRWRVGERVYADAVRDSLAADVLANLREFHRGHPLETGAPTQWLRSRLGADDAVVDDVLALLAASGKVALRQGIAVLSGFAPSLSEQERALSTRLANVLERAGIEPPSFAELAVALGVSERRLGDVARLLVRDGVLVAVEPERYYTSAAVAELRSRLEAGMCGGGEYSPAEIKEMLQLTRKFTIPFLEYCDRETYTIRGIAGRRLAQRNA